MLSGFGYSKWVGSMRNVSQLKIAVSSSCLLAALCSPAFGDTELHVGPYPQKAGLEQNGYEYVVPMGGAAAAPVVEVIQTDGVFQYIKPQAITFTTQYRADCGRGKILLNPGVELRDSENNILPSIESSFATEDAGLTGKKQLLQNYVSYAPSSLTAHSPQTACNQIIQERRQDGEPITELMRNGFWRKLDNVYETRLKYSCQGDGPGFQDIIGYSKRAPQPLYIHCVGDPDFGKTYAPTSTSTSTSSASRSQIDDALDEKRRQREALEDKFRLRGVLARGSREQSVSSPMVLQQFLALGAQKTRDEGMRLADFEIVKDGGNIYYIGLWEAGSGTNIFVEPKDVSEFSDLLRQQNANGLILTDFEAVQIGGRTHYASLWTSGRGTQTVQGAARHQYGTRDEFLEIYNANKAQNIFPVDIEVDTRDGQIVYRAAWQKFANGNGPQFMSAVTMDEFRNTREQLSSRGKEVVDIERIKRNGTEYVTALWADGSGDSAFTRPRRYDALADFMDDEIGSRHIADLEVQRASD